MDENPTDADEQFELGYCYFRGDGVPQDAKKTLYWLIKAAEQDHVEAQLLLGDIYSRMVKDYKKAVYWWTKAAEQGNSGAQNNLAVCYENGDGVSEDLEKAMYWWTKSAEQGNEEAQINLDDFKREHGIS